MLLSVESQEPVLPELRLQAVLGPAVCGAMAAGNRIVYGCGSVVVIHTSTGKPQFMLGHDKPVTVIAAHPNQVVCASGDRQALPEVVVWNCENTNILARYLPHSLFAHHY